MCEREKERGETQKCHFQPKIFAQKNVPPQKKAKIRETDGKKEPIEDRFKVRNLRRRRNTTTTTTTHEDAVRLRIVPPHRREGKKMWPFLAGFAVGTAVTYATSTITSEDKKASKFLNPGIKTTDVEVN